MDTAALLREGGGRARGQHSFVGQQGQQETLATLSAQRVLLLARLACLLWHSMRGADCNKQHQLVGWNDRTSLCLLSITHFPAVWKLSTRTKHALGSVCRCTLARVHHGVVTHVLPARRNKRNQSPYPITASKHFVFRQSRGPQSMQQPADRSESHLL